ncbi:YhgE/Pip family protein [Desemzia sp. FAM 23989]|uniref:YhgE/Pip family protein n=1 Tax=Desemzia sp. FAM 23989 TaxID=3259523 RepID=UPI003883F706
MMKKEWGFMFKHKFLLIVLGAIILIPALYNLIFLGALWDPYGNVDQLPVAVVNKDTAVNFQGKTLKIGDELVDNLKEGNSLDFHFVSEKDADEGLAAGDYYLKITIPESFSENATTLLTDEPEQMTIDYQTTQGRNLTASKMASSAITELKSEVSNQVTGMYTETILEQFGNVGSGMEEAAEGSQKLEDGTTQLVDASELIQTNLETLASSSLEFAEGSQTLSVGLKDYVAGVDQVNNGAGQLAIGIDTLSGNIPTLTTGINQLNDGAGSLANGVQQYTIGVGTLSSAASQLNTGIIGLSEQLPALTTGISHLANGASTLMTGIEQYTSGVSAVNDGVGQLDDGLSQLVEQTENLPTQVQQLNDGATQLANSLQGLNLSAENKEQLENYLMGVQAYIQQVSDVLAASDSSSVVEESSQTDLTATADAVTQALADSGVELTEEQEALVLGTMQNQSGQTEAADPAGVSQAEIDLKTKTEQLAKVTEAQMPVLEAFVDSVYQLSQSAGPAAQGIADATSQLNQSMPVLTGSLQQLQAGSQSILDGTKELVGKADTLNNGVIQLSEGLATVDGKTPALVSGVDQLADGASQIADGAEQLDSNAPALTNGAESLADGLTTVASKIPALSNGVTALLSGSQTLADGTSQLAGNSSKLVEGAGQLTNGAQQISSGSGQLAEGEAKVAGSLKQVDDGLLTLTDSLTAGADKIREVNTGKDSAEAISAPVSLDHTDEDKVANNGTSMAPYMMSVALFVGTLTANMMFDAYKPKTQPTSGIAWWASKMSILGIVSVLQAIIVFVVLIYGLGMEPIYPGKVVGFLILESMAFMSMVTLFNVVFGKVGAFLMLIFMILQLAGSGGTYPIVLSNGIYQSIYPYLPMTYAIEALRNAISIGGSMSTAVWLFVVLLVVSNGLMVVYFGIKKKSYLFDDEEVAEIN